MVFGFFAAFFTGFFFAVFFGISCFLSLIHYEQDLSVYASYKLSMLEHVKWFHVSIDPLPKQSVRVYRGRAFIPAKTRKYMDKIGEELRSQCKETFEGPLHLDIKFLMKKPKTAKRVMPSVRPDLDNLIKAVCDAATQAGIWLDDSQIVTMHAAKEYSDTPGISLMLGFY